jgi:hypothetical protein
MPTFAWKSCPPSRGIRAHDGLEYAAEAGFAEIRRSEGSGRLVGNAKFIAGLERIPGRPIARRAPGRKPIGVVSGQMELIV